MKTNKLGANIIKEIKFNRFGDSIYQMIVRSSYFKSMLKDTALRIKLRTNMVGISLQFS